MGRAGADDGVDGMLAEVLFQEPDGGPDPQEAGIGDEDIGPEPEGEAHQGRLVADGVDGVDGTRAGRSLPRIIPFIACQSVEYGIRFEDGPLDDLRFRSDVPQQGFVRHARLRILRSVTGCHPCCGRYLDIFSHRCTPEPAVGGQ